MSSMNPEKMCVKLPNGECISPFKCAHGPMLQIGQFRDLVVAEFSPLFSAKKLLKKFLLASQGKYTLTPEEISSARDLTDDIDK